MRTVNMLLAGPVLGLLCATSVSKALTTKSGSEALIFASLAVITGTLALGWIIVVILNVRNRLRDEASTRHTP